MCSLTGRFYLLNRVCSLVLCVRLHRSLQKRTSSQHLAHFFRHVKGRSHCMHVLVGKFDFL